VVPFNPAGEGSKSRVLVVEDEVVIASDLQQSLEGMGFEVVGIAASGEDAVEMAIRERPDLVLMDIVLQGRMDGAEAAEEIYSRYDIPIVYLTAYADEKLLERTRATEPFGYLIKPVDDNELRFTIEMAVYKHRAEREIKRQNVFIRHILDSLTHPFYVINVNDYTIELANPAANLGDIEAEKTTCYAVTHKSKAPCSGVEHPCTIEEVKKTRQAVTLEHIHYDKDGNAREVEVHGYPIFDGDGNIVQVIEYTLDITERKRLERQFIESQKLESVGRLAGGVAHDFSNIMSAVLGYSEMALMELPQDHPTAEKLMIIREAGEKAAALTRQLLAFSSKQALEMKPINLKAVVEDMAKMLVRMIGEDVVLRVSADAPVRNVMADRGQIEQILMNLAINARDAMPEGGRIDVGVADRDLDERFLRTHRELKPGPYVELSMADNGIGMDREVQGNIFEPFFTTKRDGKGTGLGLSTVYGIVKQHKGLMSVRSEPNKGTTFYIYLPSVAGKTQEVAIKQAPAMPQGDETVLVVDDEPTILRLVSDALEPLGYNVLRASGGGRALEMAEQAGRDIHLLLTDIVMPGMNGMELARRLRAERPGLRVLYMSGYKDQAISGEDVPESEAGFIQKPLRPGILASMVRNALDGLAPEGKEGRDTARNE
jgi:signal transduction histidine kinase/DNA-binding response OmpR family regulator